jgi:orotidine-5'-phosphate decarboxylase
MERPASRLIVALDFPSAEAALALVDHLRAIPVGMFKVGSELFTAAGPQLVREILGQRRQVFLDLKFHDIPNTVAGAVAAAASLGASLLTVHAPGGVQMMRAAAGAARAASPQTRVLAVTVLTSLARQELKRSGVSRSPQQQVLALAKMAREAGLDGVVASPQEVEALRRRFPKPFLLVTPGIRPTWAAAAGDQKRVATPSAALAAGADYIVVGRPITAAPDPAQAAARIVDELANASRKF